jgi:hypothetical protein
MEIKITLTEAEHKALAYVALDPVDWVQNAAQARAMAAMEEIFQEAVRVALADPNTTSIPADREAVVLASTLPSAAERQAMMDQQVAETLGQQAE